MSFSTDIKDEITRNEYTPEEQLALLSSLIKINGTLSMSNKNFVVDVRTESAKVAKLIFLIIQSTYKIDCRLLVSKKNKLNKNNVYIEIANALSELNVKVMSLNTSQNKREELLLRIGLLVKDRNQLQQVKNKLSSLSLVYEVL